MEFKEECLKNILQEIIDYRGKTPKKLGGEWSKAGIRALSAKNIKTGKIVQENTIKFVNEELYKKWMKKEVEKGTILITSEAPFGEIFYWDSEEKIVLSQRIFGIKINKDYNSQYIYYYMMTRNFKNQLNCRATGSTVTGLRQPELLKCKIKIPNKENQDKIASILKNIDRKIEINNQINDSLLELGDILYKAYFGNKTELPRDWKVCKLKEVANNYDSKRKPMSSREREKHPGKYPYYGATSIIDYVEDYIFDGIYLLMGEDGTVVTSEGNPVLQYIWGKNWVNNHAHVLEGKIISTEHLMFCLRNCNVRNIITGAVQPKINQENMNNINIVLADEQTNKKYEKTIHLIMKQYRSNREENRKLEQVRDLLLPKLMNGEINLENEVNEQYERCKN